MKVSLTTRYLDNIKPGAKVINITDAATRNLKMVVSPTGRKMWRYKGRVDGEVATYTLGPYPKHSLQDARLWASNINDLRIGGYNLPPLGERAKPRQSPRVRKRQNFDWLFETYMAEEGNSLASAHERRRIYQKDIKPAIGDMAIDEIRHDDLAKILRAKKDGGAPVVSNTIQSLLRRVFRWAATKGRDLTGLEHDPAQYLVKLTVPKDRVRYLNDFEIGIFFRAIPRIEDAFGEALTAILYMGFRRSEAFEMTWDEVNLGSGDIEIEGSRLKNGRALVLYIPSVIREMLIRRKEATGHLEFVWPAPDSLAAEMDEESGSAKPYITFSKNMQRLNKECARLAALEGKEFPNFTIHDLRRTLSSGMHALKDEKRRSLVPTDVVERVLNHVIGGVRGVYNRHDYYEEKMNALEAWAAHLDAIKASTNGQ